MHHLLFKAGRCFSHRISTEKNTRRNKYKEKFWYLYNNYQNYLVNILRRRPFITPTIPYRISLKTSPYVFPLFVSAKQTYLRH